MYESIVPPAFPSRHALVLISGFFEVVGGLGLLLKPLRQAAGIGLIALLIAVFPSNLWMALHPERFADLHLPAWAFWVRLPIQPLLMMWIWIVSRR